MNKKKWIWFIVPFAVIGLFVSKTLLKSKKERPEKTAVQQAEDTSYWTCSMHPQIHSDKPGECPICHMKLIQVKTEKVEKQSSPGAGRSDVQASSAQITLLGIQKTKVETMDLKLILPISGRLLSSSSVAFQVYENDLRYVKTGLTFKGESSFAPDQEIEGVISSVDSIVDPTSRTVRVVGSIKKGPRGLFSETSFRGEIEIELKNRVAIPESSVLHTGRGDLVYIFVDEMRVSPRTVKLGPKTETFFEVLDGLKAGDIISSGPNFLIDSEAQIRGTQSGGSNDQKNH